MKTLKKSILTLVALSAPKPTGGLQADFLFIIARITPFSVFTFFISLPLVFLPHKIL